MSTKPEISKEPDARVDTGFPAPDDDFLTYPIHKLVSVFEDPDKVVEAVDELKGAGFTMDDIEAFCGWKNEKGREFEGTRPGIWDSILHAGRHIGPARTYIERYERSLQDGHCIIMVKVTKKNRKERAADILHRHTNERVTYFGLLMADEMQ